MNPSTICIPQSWQDHGKLPFTLEPDLPQSQLSLPTVVISAWAGGGCGRCPKPPASQVRFWKGTRAVAVRSGSRRQIPLLECKTNLDGLEIRPELTSLSLVFAAHHFQVGLHLFVLHCLELLESPAPLLQRAFPGLLILFSFPPSSCRFLSFLQSRSSVHNSCSVPAVLPVRYYPLDYKY